MKICNNRRSHRRDTIRFWISLSQWARAGAARDLPEGGANCVRRRRTHPNREILLAFMDYTSSNQRLGECVRPKLICLKWSNEDKWERNLITQRFEGKIA